MNHNNQLAEDTSKERIICTGKQNKTHFKSQEVQCQQVHINGGYPSKAETFHQNTKAFLSLPTGLQSR